MIDAVYKVCFAVKLLVCLMINHLDSLIGEFSRCSWYILGRFITTLSVSCVNSNGIWICLVHVTVIISVRQCRATVESHSDMTYASYFYTDILLLSGEHLDGWYLSCWNAVTVHSQVGTFYVGIGTGRIRTSSPSCRCHICIFAGCQTFCDQHTFPLPYKIWCLEVKRKYHHVCFICQRHS